jgi:hypothetical protein
VQIWSKKKSVQMLLQQSSSEGGNKSSDFLFRDMCDALLPTNIQFWALNIEKLKHFLEVNCGRSIPDEFTLRKN